MNIRINDKYRITSDSANFILEECHIGDKEGSMSFGKEVWKQVGFYQSINGLLNGLLRRTALESDAKTIQGLKDVFDGVHESIDALTEQLGEKK